MLPLTIPHGVDFYHLRRDLDVDCHEPIYLAVREDIAERVANTKQVLRFPHPWLLAIQSHVRSNGAGTLFLAPPPSEHDFQLLYDAIPSGDYAKPWGVLIKEREAKAGDFEWWSARGFTTHSAGKIADQNFYQNLKEIISRYELVASPNMSSALIFAVAMGKKVQAIPDIELMQLDVYSIEKYAVLEGVEVEKVRHVWTQLLSNDQAAAINQARELLGYQYMDSPERLRERFIAATNSVTMPVHLSPMKDGLLYMLCIHLIHSGIPVQKLFPNPFRKLIEKILALFGLNRLSVLYGSDFSHYGIAGSAGSLEVRAAFAFQLGASAKPGLSVRDRHARCTRY